MKRTVIIMTKVPTAGNVKTRLQPFLSSDECAALSEAFLQDAVNKAETVCENVILAYTPPDKINVLKKNLSPEKQYFEQTGNDLGEKMFNAFEFAFGQKSAAVVMVGTDSPTFASDFIEQAFEFLETDADLVLGKSEDGGFYLIGQRRKNHSKLFENIRWSSAEVFEQTKKNAARLELRLKEIPIWYDVDTPADFIKLRKELIADNEAKRNAPKTYQWLLSNSNLFVSI